MLPIVENVNILKNFITNNLFAEALKFIEDNNVCFSHLNIEGESVANILSNKLFHTLRRYGIPNEVIDSNELPLFTKIIDNLLNKEPNFWFYKSYDGREKIYTWPVVYMLENNQPKVMEFLELIKYPNIISYNEMQDHYLYERKISWELNCLIKEKSNLTKFDIINISKDYSASPDNLNTIIDYYKNTPLKFVYNHEKVNDFLSFFFQHTKTPDINSFKNKFTSICDFLQPFLIKRHKKNQEEINSTKIEDIMQNIIKYTLSASVSTLNLDKQYFIPALVILSDLFPKIALTDYLPKQSFRNSLTALGFIPDNIELNFKNHIFKNNPEDAESNPFANKNFIYNTSDQYFSTMFVTLLAEYVMNGNKILDSSFSANDNNLNNLNIYQEQFPEQFKKDFNLFKEGMNILELPLTSSNERVTNYLLFLELDNNMSITQTHVKKHKI